MLKARNEPRSEGKKNSIHQADNLIMPNILVVDDEPASRHALTIILRPFAVLSVGNSAEDAIAVLKERPIDIVTLEVKLPGRSGLETLQEIRRLFPNVDVIFITGRGTLASALAALRYGAAGYLIKPFNAMELVRLVVQLTQKKQALASTL